MDDATGQKLGKLAFSANIQQDVISSLRHAISESVHLSSALPDKSFFFLQCSYSNASPVPTTSPPSKSTKNDKKVKGGENSKGEAGSLIISKEPVAMEAEHIKILTTIVLFQNHDGQEVPVVYVVKRTE